MVKIGAAQIRVTKNANENLNKIINYIKKAASRNADIICFPEGSLIHSKNKNYIKKIPINNYINKIKNACKENKIHCIFGTALMEKNKLYNTAFFIDDKGKIIYKYYKKNLWKSETKVTINGKRNKIVNTKFGKIGLIICWDIAYPEYVKELGKKGAWIIFCPSYVINYKRELESYEQLPLARSFENSCYFVYCDAYAKDTVKYSYICGPSRIYSKIRNKEGMIIAELDKRKIMLLKRYYGLVKIS
ncbi:carbon-nitrogen hydrolase family protein [Candidatus Woesearchaeota archaeon]|nr:carbon-nitrogen hydrolase family protein [Candidatus Woesearchaeota archaeon]